MEPTRRFASELVMLVLSYVAVGVCVQPTTKALQKVKGKVFARHKNSYSDIFLVSTSQNGSVSTT